jgi:hypothetical protein
MNRLKTIYLIAILVIMANQYSVTAEGANIGGNSCSALMSEGFLEKSHAHLRGVFEGLNVFLRDTNRLNSRATRIISKQNAYVLPLNYTDPLVIDGQLSFLSSSLNERYLDVKNQDGSLRYRIDLSNWPVLDRIYQIRSAGNEGNYTLIGMKLVKGGPIFYDLIHPEVNFQTNFESSDFNLVNIGGVTFAIFKNEELSFRRAALWTEFEIVEPSTGDRVMVDLSLERPVISFYLREGLKQIMQKLEDLTQKRAEDIFHYR